MTAADLSSKGIAELVSLRGRRAFVTGGGRGIGEAVVRRLAEAGADVAVGDVDAGSATAAAAEVAAFGVRAVGVGLDVRSEASVDAAFDVARADLGGVDILVNCAGIFPAASLQDTSDEDWDNVFNINLTGMFRCCRRAAAIMTEQGTGGVMVNMASTNSYRAGRPNMATYTSSKHGVVGLTQALALELAPADIRVVGIAPGTVDTPGVREAAAGFAAAGLADLPAKVAATVPMGRMLVPDDIARVVLFAASDLALMVTGSTILVEGGRFTL